VKGRRTDHGEAMSQAGGEELLVHNWRVDRLTRLGVPGSLAEA